LHSLRRAKGQKKKKKKKKKNLGGGVFLVDLLTLGAAAVMRPRYGVLTPRGKKEKKRKKDNKRGREKGKKKREKVGSRRISENG